MTNQELVDLHVAMLGIGDAPADPEFCFALATNVKALKPLYDKLIEFGKAPEKYREYEGKRIGLCHEFAAKDADGRARVDETKNFVIPQESKAGFEERLEAVKAEYADAIEAFKEQKAQTELHMEEEVEDLPVLKRVPLSIFPRVITPNRMRFLLPIIETEASKAESDIAAE
jgi:hypothetical protein